MKGKKQENKEAEGKTLSPPPPTPPSPSKKKDKTSRPSKRRKKAKSVSFKDFFDRNWQNSSTPRVEGLKWVAL